MVTATYDGLRVWEASGFVPVRRITPPRDASRDTDFYLADVIFAPDGRVLATVSNQPGIRLWRIADGGHVARLRSQATYRLDAAIAFSPDGTRAVTAGAVRAFLWNARTGAELARMHQPGGVLELAFSPDGSSVLTSGFDGRVRVWDAGDGALLRELKVADGPGAGVALAPDGRTAVVVTAKGVVLARDVATGGRRRLRGDPGEPRSARRCSTPTGTLLYVATGNMGFGYDGPGARTNARVWDVGTGRSVVALRDTAAHGPGLFSPDGRLLMTRDAGDGQCVGRIDGGGDRDDARAWHRERRAARQGVVQPRRPARDHVRGRRHDQAVGRSGQASASAPPPARRSGGLHGLVRPLQSCRRSARDHRSRLRVRVSL